MRIPDPDEYRRRWAAMDRGARRRIVRAVNRGEALDDRNEAAMAVATARRQQRFWRWAWLLGPIAALITAPQGLVPYGANALLSTLILGVMAYFWYRRAQRAEAINEEAARTSKRRKKKRREPPADGRDHLPGRRRP